MVLFLLLVLAWSLFILWVGPSSSPSSQLGLCRPGGVHFGAFCSRFLFAFLSFCEAAHSFFPLWPVCSCGCSFGGVSPVLVLDHSPISCGSFSGLLGLHGSGLLLQQPSSLFLTLVPSFSRALSSGFPVCFPLSSFQCRLFFLLLLRSYLSGVAMGALLAVPAVCSAFLFAKADVPRLLSDFQSSSSLRSQQSLVAISSRSAGARSGLFPSHGSPARRYPPGLRCCDSGSQACGSCRG